MVISTRVKTLPNLGKETDHAVSPQSGNGNSDQRRTTGHDDAVDDIDVKMELSQHGLEKIKGDFLRQDGGRVARELTLLLTEERRIHNSGNAAMAARMVR